MALSKIQSIVARLSLAEEARAKAENTWSTVREPYKGEELDGELQKLRIELLLAGLKDLAGHDGVTMQILAVQKPHAVPVIVTMAPAPGRSAKRSFGPKLAGLLNGCRNSLFVDEQQFLQEVKPTDRQCMRSLNMIQRMIAHVALDHCNGAPEEVLDPITPTEMAAFAFPGGLLSTQSGARAEPTPRA